MFGESLGIQGWGVIVDSLVIVCIAVRQAPSLLDLPPELLLRVFNFLSPVDLCRFSQVHPSLHSLAFDGSLWQHLHPIRWANGHHQFVSPLTFEAEEEEEEEVRDWRSTACMPVATENNLFPLN